jgi:hypothetical protein
MRRNDSPRMKSRIIWAAVLLTAIAGFYAVTIRPTQVSSPGFSRKSPPLRHLQPPEIAPPPLPLPVFETPTLAPPPMAQTILPLPGTTRLNPRRPQPTEVPIQPNATIDFSPGGIPVIRSGGKDQEAIDRALKEMAEATKDTVFPPTKK